MTEHRDQKEGHALDNLRVLNQSDGGFEVWTMPDKCEDCDCQEYQCREEEERNV